MIRNGLLLIAWLCMAAALTPVAGAESGAGAPPPLTFVTFNLFHGGPLSGLTGKARYLDRRLEMAAEGLQSLHADIVGLQEASWSRQRGEVAARLAARLGYSYIYAPASSRFFGNRPVDRAIAVLLNFTEGPAILSRFPILRWQVDDLPRCGKVLDSRVLLSAMLGTPWGPLQVFSAHTRGDLCQTRRVAELVRERRGSLPSVLMGDFNAAAESPAIAALTQGAGFIDAFQQVNPNLPGLTVWQQVDAPVSTVRRRSDYVFVIPGRDVPGRVLSSRVVLNAPQRLPDGTALWPSDHYGVMADLGVFAPRAEASAHAPADRTEQRGPHTRSPGRL
jgi:endonuclease/exonuclease/phosphatase family metal-dependent hydrolase